MSSKVRVPRMRRIIDVPKQDVRDPRFAEHAGRFDIDKFREAYGFLDEQLEKDTQRVRKAMKKTKSQARRSALQAELTRLQQQAARQHELDGKRTVMKGIRERQSEAVSRGAKPYFPKRREVRDLLLAERYRGLVERGGQAAADRALRKKRARNAQKDKRQLGAGPRARRSAAEEDGGAGGGAARKRVRP